MKIDLTQPLKDRKGRPMKFEDEDATLGLMAYAALATADNVDRAERLKRGRLAQRIEASGKEIDLESHDITLIKECIGKIFPPLVVAITEDMLEGRPNLSVVADK